MDYNSLVASKGTAGSILNWAGYSKMDAPTLLEEAQGLLFQFLRTREMRKEWSFTVPAYWSSNEGSSHIVSALPTGFLDPIGHIYDANGQRYVHNIESMVREGRAFDDEITGTLTNNGITTAAAGSGVCLVVKTDTTELTQGSFFTIAGAATVDGLNVNGTWQIIGAYPDSNAYYIDTGGSATAGATAGGGAAMTYSARNLVAGQPTRWSIWDEHVQFDAAFDQATPMSMFYYKQPPMLSAAQPTNFLTSRYPRLLRAATQVVAIDFMQDNENYQKGVAALQSLISQTAAADDFSYRGASFGTENP